MKRTIIALLIGFATSAVCENRCVTYMDSGSIPTRLRSSENINWVAVRRPTVEGLEIRAYEAWSDSSRKTQRTFFSTKSDSTLRKMAVYTPSTDSMWIDTGTTNEELWFAVKLMLKHWKTCYLPEEK